MLFSPDGSYEFRVDDRVDASGTYAIQGDRYTEDTDYLPCQAARTATYTWEFDGKNLAFHLLGEDQCTDRRASLDGIAWILLEQSSK